MVSRKDFSNIPFSIVNILLSNFEELFNPDKSQGGVGARLAFTSADKKFEIYVVECPPGLVIDDIREADRRNWEVSKWFTLFPNLTLFYAYHFLKF